MYNEYYFDKLYYNFCKHYSYNFAIRISLFYHSGANNNLQASFVIVRVHQPNIIKMSLCLSLTKWV